MTLFFGIYFFLYLHDSIRATEPITVTFQAVRGQSVRKIATSVIARNLKMVSNNRREGYIRK